MSNAIVGKGWSFPPRTSAQGKLLLTNTKTEIEESILIILMTAIGERVMRPTFGSRLHELLFAPNNGATAIRAERFVEDALGMWEPRIRVTNVAATPNHPHRAAELIITIEYEVKVTHDRRSLVYPFYLIPEEQGSIDVITSP